MHGPAGGLRLLQGLADSAPDPSLATHLDRWGPLGRAGPALLRELEASGLAGHGGAWFPVSTKWQAVAAAGRRPVVVANGAEGEPASRKDALLLARSPHLVLDGLSMAAATLQAGRAIAYVPASGAAAVAEALRERRAQGTDVVDIELVESPDAYLAGQETAVVNALTGRRRAVPSFVGLQSIRARGVDGRPTLVQNVETLAHVALVGRFGAAWFRQVGSADAPGTVLLTITGTPGARATTVPRVVEAAQGTPLAAVAGVTASDLRGIPGILLGGYGGGWVTPDVFLQLTVSEKAARHAGTTLGPGIVAFLSPGTCPLSEMAAVVRSMEGEGAGQCGPCVYGLAELADAMEHLALVGGRTARPDRILETGALLEGRGACRHPDGVVRFVRTGLSVFSAEVLRHQRGGPCSGVHGPRVLPLARQSRTKRLVSRA